MVAPCRPNPLAILASGRRPIIFHAIIQLLGAQLMDFRAIGAVVQHADKYRKVVATNCVEFLCAHHKAAVTACQDDGLVRPRRGDTDSMTELVADSTELADCREMICTDPLHLCGEKRVVPRAVHVFPVLRYDSVTD